MCVQLPPGEKRWRSQKFDLFKFWKFLAGLCCWEWFEWQRIEFRFCVLLCLLSWIVWKRVRQPAILFLYICDVWSFSTGEISWVFLLAARTMICWLTAARETVREYAPSFSQPTKGVAETWWTRIEQSFEQHICVEFLALATRIHRVLFCNQQVSKIMHLVGDPNINIYNIYGKCYHGKINPTGTPSLYHPFNVLMSKSMPTPEVKVFCITSFMIVDCSKIWTCYSWELVCNFAETSRHTNCFPPDFFRQRHSWQGTTSRLFRPV